MIAWDAVTGEPIGNYDGGPEGNRLLIRGDTGAEGFALRRVSHLNPN